MSFGLVVGWRGFLGVCAAHGRTSTFVQQTCRDSPSPVRGASGELRPKTIKRQTKTSGKRKETDGGKRRLVAETLGREHTHPDLEVRC
ncbi:hypothetical protein BKA81DRAFT_362958 [Phyllosticta paracitricarpa]|uniref:Secreted protein n=1 Tax=Phyllosticta paracitricarpa TaxID=2016321 RepID=A0ABR1N3S1_9PEZI